MHDISLRWYEQEVNQASAGKLVAEMRKGRWFHARTMRSAAFPFWPRYIGAVSKRFFSPAEPIQLIEIESAEDLPLARNSAGSNEGIVGSSSPTGEATRLERDSLTIGAGRVGHLELLPSLWIPARSQEQEAPTGDHPEMKIRLRLPEA